MKIGTAQMRPVVETAITPFASSSFLNELSADDIAPHAEWLNRGHIVRQTGELILSHHSWLVEVNGKRILIDPCVGNGRNRPLLPVYHQLDTPWIQRLEALGTTPEEIDYVFCTHLHVDHVGWNTHLVNGRWVPTFPNARYLLPRGENDYWRRDLDGLLKRAEAFNMGIYAECVQPVIEAGLADMVDAGHRCADALRLIDAPGHTAGHMGAVLESSGEGAVFCGDAIHHPLQVIYPDRAGFAFNPQQACSTRRMLLDLCIDKDYWLAPGHFIAPHVCKISRNGESYAMHWAEGL